MLAHVRGVEMQGKTRARSGLSILALTGVAAIASCKEGPPAFPSAVIDVETDLPVPRVISRLRVDVYDERGAWTESRRFSLADATDVPTSFGIVLRDDTRTTSVLVRVRGYAEGAERDYLGERFVERVPYVPRATPQTLAELCANAPELPRNETRVFRAGPKALFRRTCDELTNMSGSVAAKVTITEKARYHFGLLPILTVETSETVADSASLHLVRDCLQPETTLGCNVEIDPEGGSVGNIETELEPGTYALVTGAFLPTSTGDIALHWTLASEWVKPPRPLPPFPTGDTSITALPLTLKTSEVPTPTSEPAPDATVDRLLRLELRPGEPQRARVVLGGACAGTMAKLAIVNGAVDAAASMACKPESGRLEPVSFGGDPGGTITPFADGPCTSDESDDNSVCVPGGTVALGSTGVPFPGNVTESPQRIAGISKFWLDRYEFTVGRFRAALKSGFEPSIPQAIFGPVPNEGPIVQDSINANGTFSETRKDRDDHPLTVVGWLTAREICRYLGGDLPTEAQWEYAASHSAGAKRFYPWGDAPASCDVTVAGRQVSSRLCKGPTLVAVNDDALSGDVNELGIIGLAGNVAEWVLGSPKPYDDLCFRGAPVLDPVCFDPTEPGRILRGGDWRIAPSGCRTVLRRRRNAAAVAGNIGFRCAYKERPGR